MNERVCRACGGRYGYPVRGALATRTHCETCASLPANVRRALESVRRQLAELRGEVRTLKDRLDERDPA